MESGFDCNLEATELRLGLPGSSDVTERATVVSRGSKRAVDTTNEEDSPSTRNEAKAQVVGWPPVRSYRRNNIQTKKNDVASDIAGIYVKVSMDGAPYLRKIDLKVYKGYKDLRVALEDMFKSSSLGEYVITYEDKDGDWMMVGDVPWEMFISSCKRLRIMKGSEARGLGPRP